MSASASGGLPLRPVISCQADLEQMWRRLMTPLGFSGYSLWMVVIEDARAVPHVLELAEMPESPEDGDVEALAGVFAHLAGARTRLAFLRTRPGTGPPTAGDRAWALALYDAGRLCGASLDVIHLAHDHDVLPMTMDDLATESA